MYVDYKEIGRRIAARRKELGLKQSKVTELAGLSDKYLSNIETARSIPSIEVLMKICDVLNVTPDYFLVGSVNINETNDIIKIIDGKLQYLNKEKQIFVCDFIDWLIEQENKKISNKTTLI